ncbi:uncharacterized protein VICG_00767 [Vittaforma corneae ATCC 50505]|uniref:Uncharacterized protein n=1 Tax=Vittaforma corneae (strain ATCC 50505) TaxID=993615 RepID=L2GMT4_VITCO|nr:uncharacterized protein VICG_00767 [Vittaforma corneae ATCC 50505]ELA42126.1 hypothetical protein VICG_00767 [Vittaforma corneae ATCC 50505]
MPLIIQRKSSKFTLKKRYITLLCIIISFSIMLYRAYYVVYHFRALRLGKLALEQVNIIKKPENNVKNKTGGPLYIEVTMNVSKCTCPVFLEMSDINGALFLDEKSYDSSAESLRIAISNIKFDKQKPFIFKAVLEFTNVSFNTPILDLYSLDFSIEVSFLIRARFCFLPLCFPKILRRKKSELLIKGGDSVNPSFLSMRLHKLNDIPCIQLGIKKKFFSILNSDSKFTFNVGCIKLSFDGIASFSILVTSFSTEDYLIKNDTRVVSSFEYLTNIIPGEQLSNTEDPDDSIVFYFINIPLYNFGNFMDIPQLLKKLNNTRGKKLLRLSAVSVLMGGPDVPDLFLSDTVKRYERVGFDVDDNLSSKTIKYAKIDEQVVEGCILKDLNKIPKDQPLFIEGWRPSKLFIFSVPSEKTANTSKTSEKNQLNEMTVNDDVSQSALHCLKLWIRDWTIHSDKFSFNTALNKDHPIYALFERLFSEEHWFVDFFNIESSVKLTVNLNGIKYLEISISFPKHKQTSLAFEDDKQSVLDEVLSEQNIIFDDVLLISVKILQKFILKKDDIKSLKIVPSEILVGEHRIIPPDLFYISIDYPHSINIASLSGDVFPIYLFKKNSQHSIIFDHLLSNYLNSNFIQIDSTLDLSTYGFLEGTQKETKSIKKLADGAEESFIRVDLPRFTFSVTNSFMKLRANVLPTTIEYSLSLPDPPRKLPHCRGVVNIVSALIFQKTWDRSKVFIDAFNSETISVTLASRMFCFDFSINELCCGNDSTNSSNASSFSNDIHNDKSDDNASDDNKRRPFFRVFPIEIAYDQDKPLENLSHIKFSIFHTCFDDKYLLEDYMKIRDTEVYSKHGLYSYFDQSKILFSKLKSEINSPFYIKNILRAKKGTFIGFVRGIPLFSLEAFDKAAVLVLTTKNVFLYLTDIVKIYFKLISPIQIREYLKNPEDWIGKHPLHFLADFILEAICRDGYDVTKSMLAYRQRAGNIYVSADVDIKKSKSENTNHSIFNNSSTLINKDEEMVVYLRIAIPKVLVKKINCVKFNLYGTLLFESINEQDSPFTIQVDLKSERLDYVLELNSTINLLAFKNKVQSGATFNSKSIGMYRSSLQELCSLFTEFIYSFKSSISNEYTYEINYVSEEMKKAFCSDSELCVDSFYVIDTTMARKASLIQTTNSSVYLPPIIDISVCTIEGTENSIKVHTSLGLDLLVNLIGEHLHAIFSSLPIDVWPDSIILNVDFHNFFTYKCLSERNGIVSTIFYLKFLLLKNRIISLKIPINSPSKTFINGYGDLSLKSNPIYDENYSDSSNNDYDDSEFANDFVPVYFYSPNNRPGILERLLIRCKDYFCGAKYKNIVNFTPDQINTSFKLPPQILNQYTSYRNRMFSLKNANNLDLVFEMGSDDFSQIIMNLVSDSDACITHSFTEPFNSCMFDFTEHTPSSDKPIKPFFIFNMNSRNLLLLSVRIPFTVRFIDESAYLIGYANSFIRFVIMLKGCFMDSYMASRGYYLSIPIFFPTIDSIVDHLLPVKSVEYKEYHSCRSSGGYFKCFGNVKQQVKMFIFFRNAVICQNLNVQATPFSYNFVRLIDWLYYIFSNITTSKVNVFTGHVAVIEFRFPVDSDFLKGYGAYAIDSDRLIKLCLSLSESHSGTLTG